MGTSYAYCRRVPTIYRVCRQEEEVQMMREMQSGEGAGGVVRRIRSLRAETDNNKEEARQAHSVARWRCIKHTCNPRSERG